MENEDAEGETENNVFDEVTGALKDKKGYLDGFNIGAHDK